MSTILLVEDAIELAQVLIRELSHEGFTVLHAVDGLRALELHAVYHEGIGDSQDIGRRHRIRVI